MATRAEDLKEQVEEGTTGIDHMTTEKDHVTSGEDRVATGVNHVTTADMHHKGEGHPQRAESGEKGKLQKEPTTTRTPPEESVNVSENKVDTPQIEAQGTVDLIPNGNKVLQRANAFKKRSPPKADGPDTSVLLQSNMKTSFRYKKIAMKPERPIFTKGEGEGEGGSSDDDTESLCSSGDQGGGVIIDEVHLKKVGPNFEAKVPGIHSAHKMASASSSGKVQYRVRANSYSKITMTAVTQEVSRHYPQRVNAPSSPTTTDTSVTTSEGDRSGDPRGPSPLPAQDSDVFLCPVPAPTSERRACYSTNSLNSLDAIDLEPPEMFKQGTTACGEEEGGGGGGEGQTSKDTAHPTLEGGGDLATSADRRSVESSDTGYTSGVSPAALHDVKELAVLGRAGSKKIALGRALSGDGSKLYVPMVFFTPAVGKDRNLFAVQVCLVECSDGLIKVGRGE